MCSRLGETILNIASHCVNSGVLLTKSSEVIVTTRETLLNIASSLCNGVQISNRQWCFYLLYTGVTSTHIELVKYISDQFLNHDSQTSAHHDHN